MYKVYLSPATNYRGFGIDEFGLESYRMNEIANILEKLLINEGHFIVYRNKENMTREEIIKDSDNFFPDIHVAIHSYSSDNKGIEIYTKVGSEVSNGFAKEIYKELYKIYYNKTVDPGVIYNDKIIEIMSVKSPAVLVNVGCHKSADDVNWMLNNKEKIAEAIKEGIVKATKLRPC